MKKIKNAVCFLFVFLFSFYLVSCSFFQNNSNASEPKSKVYFDYFDTVSYIYSYSQDDDMVFEKKANSIGDILMEYHRLFDIYNEYDGIPNLCTVNKQAGKSSVKVDRKLIDFMKYAKDVYYLTDGKVNVMMGEVLSVWRECRDISVNTPENAYVPSEDVLNEAKDHIDIALLEIDEVESTLYISDPKASIDVGALGKGYAAEKIAEQLEKDNLYGYVLNIGGNIKMIGKKANGDGWITGIKHPYDPENKLALKLDLSDTSCVTSGSYERYFTVDGNNYHHIIDVDTLFPANHFLSVSVITDDSGLADALSTALFCMDYEKGLELISSLNGVDAVWIDLSGNILYSENISKNVI